MIHPYLENLSTYTISQLEDKMSKLNRAYFVSSNQEVRQQIILLLDSYKLEIESRNATEKLKQTEQGENGLDGLINVS